jgi:hypothetical protein
MMLNAASNWRAPRTVMIQPHVFRSLKTKAWCPTYTRDEPIARIPSIRFQVPATSSMIEANMIQPPPLAYSSAATRPDLVPA